MAWAVLLKGLLGDVQGIVGISLCLGFAVPLEEFIGGCVGLYRNATGLWLSQD